MWNGQLFVAKALHIQAREILVRTRSYSGIADTETREQRGQEISTVSSNSSNLWRFTSRKHRFSSRARDLGFKVRTFQQPQYTSRYASQILFRLKMSIKSALNATVLHPPGGKAAKPPLALPLQFVDDPKNHVWSFKVELVAIGIAPSSAKRRRIAVWICGLDINAFHAAPSGPHFSHLCEIP